MSGSSAVLAGYNFHCFLEECAKVAHPTSEQSVAAPHSRKLQISRPLF